MNLNAPHFRDDEAARKHFEAQRWPGGERVCPHCGTVGGEYATKRAGRYRCGSKECRKDFSVTTGTVMEASHVRLSHWAWTFYQMCASKKGVSAHQVHRTLGITYRSAWFLCHRVREAMKAGGLADPMGGPGGVVEADETYFGKFDVAPTETTSGRPFTKSGKQANRRPIVSLVERGGSVRSFHVANADKETVGRIVRENISPLSRLHTDESRLYVGLDDVFASHETVKHSAGEYARGDVTTNSVEGYFSVFKRGMRGTYQFCGEKHLHRYLHEFDFRFNTRSALGFDDLTRCNLAIKGAEGKRLTYRRARRAAVA